MKALIFLFFMTGTASAATWEYVAPLTCKEWTKLSETEDDMMSPIEGYLMENDKGDRRIYDSVCVVDWWILETCRANPKLTVGEAMATVLYRRSQHWRLPEHHCKPDR